MTTLITMVVEMSVPMMSIVKVEDDSGDNGDIDNSDSGGSNNDDDDDCEGNSTS